MQYCLRPSRTGCPATICPYARSRTRIRSGNCWTSTIRGAIGYAVVVAPDGDEAVVADAALQLESGIEAMLGALGGERLSDDALRRANELYSKLAWTLCNLSAYRATS